MSLLTTVTLVSCVFSLLHLAVCAASASAHGQHQVGQSSPPAAAARKLLAHPSPSPAPREAPLFDPAALATGLFKCDCTKFCPYCSGNYGRKLITGLTYASPSPAPLPTCPPVSATDANVVSAATAGMKALNAMPAVLLDVFHTQTPLVLQSITTAIYCNGDLYKKGYATYLITVQAMLPTGTYNGNVYGQQLIFNMEVSWVNQQCFGALKTVSYKDYIYIVSL